MRLDHKNSNKVRLSRCDIPTKKAAGSWGTLRLLIGDMPGCVGSLYYYVINHTRILHVYLINTDASAGCDHSFDHFAVLAHHVTKPRATAATRCGGRTRASAGLFFGLHPSHQVAPKRSTNLLGMECAPSSPGQVPSPAGTWPAGVRPAGPDVPVTDGLIW